MLVSRLIAMSVLATCLSFGCAETTTTARAPKSAASEYEAEPPYQEGLSRTLEGAPTTYAAEAMTRHYTLGYATGRLEGSEHRQKETAEASAMGCIGIAPALLELAGGHFRGIDVCEGMKRADLHEANIGGPRFAKSRLLVARKGAETGDPRITQMLLTAFENGYAMGFERSAEEHDPLAEMRAAVAAGCVRHVQMYAADSPLLERCPPLGQQFVAGYLENLSRIRAQRRSK